MADALDVFNAEQKKNLPIEVDILTRLWNDFAADGNPIVNVYDGEQDNPIADFHEFERIVYNLDECYLNTRNGWVRIVFGNGWDSLVDYTINIETERVVDPINKWIESHW